MYYPSGYPGYGMPSSQPKNEGGPRQTEEADVSNQNMAAMYPGMGMQPGSSAYPYGYPPYYSYPGSQYPYSYPSSSSYPYSSYYPRQYSDMYMGSLAQAPAPQPQQQPNFGSSMPAYPPPSSYQQPQPQQPYPPPP